MKKFLVFAGLLLSLVMVASAGANCVMVDSTGKEIKTADCKSMLINVANGWIRVPISRAGIVPPFFDYDDYRGIDRDLEYDRDLIFYYTDPACNGQPLSYSNTRSDGTLYERVHNDGAYLYYAILGGPATPGSQITAAWFPGWGCDELLNYYDDRDRFAPTIQRDISDFHAKYKPPFRIK